jgi:hypothetical protein
MKTDKVCTYFDGGVCWNSNVPYHGEEVSVSYCNDRCYGYRCRYKYIYIHKRLGWFRFSFYRLNKKLTIRFEISKGWE